MKLAFMVLVLFGVMSGPAMATVVVLNSKPGCYYVHRSAVTGRVVSKEYAQRNPRTTVRERVCRRQ